MDSWYLDEYKRSTRNAFAFGWLSAAARTAADRMERNGMEEAADELRTAIDEALDKGAEHADTIWGDGE